MNNQFDELTKSMAQAVTRRAALKKLGVSLAGMALACFGLANKANANTYSGYCQIDYGLISGDPVVWTGQCVDPNACVSYRSADCPAPGTSATRRKGHKAKIASACGSFFSVATNYPCSFTT